MRLTRTAERARSASRRSSASAVPARTRGARAGWIAAALAAAAGTFAAAADAAPISSSLDPGSRVTVVAPDPGVTATAADGDTLYLGGAIGHIGYRASGLAVLDSGDARLQRSFPELDGTSSTQVGSADGIVPDGAGGAYVLGVSRGAGGIRQRGLLHVRSDGSVDTAFRPSFRDADGTASSDVRDIAIGPDGTVFVAGGFARVGDEARGGLAALDAATGAPRAWNAQLAGTAGDPPVVDSVALAGDQLLLAGDFDRAGGQARAGLAAVARADGAVTAWAPTGLDGDSASVDLLTSGTTAYLVAGTTVREVTTSGQGSVRDLALAADAPIRGAVLDDDSLYLTGAFATIGGATRAGLAEVALPAGTVTGWDPGQAGTVGGHAVAVDGDRVYVAIAVDDQPFPAAWGGVERCGLAAVERDASAAIAAWSPDLARDGDCSSDRSVIAVSGGKVWAAGTFTLANVESRDNLAAVDLATDTILPWAPSVTAAPRDLAVSPDGATVYGVGAMTAVNGVPRSRAFAVAGAPSGAADAAADVRAWDPVLASTGTALALALSPDGLTVARVYVGGNFTRVRGDSRYRRLVAVAPDTGAPVETWLPAAGANISDVALADDGTLYVAGRFTTIGSDAAERRGLAAFTAASDVPTAWNPALDDPEGGSVLDLAISGDVVYTAGTFNGTIGGAARRGVAALRRGDGGAVADWNPQLDGSVATVSTVADGTVYLIGGDAIDASGRFTTVGGQPRPAGLASVTAAGTVTGWAPQAPTYLPSAFVGSTEVQEVAGRIVVPGFVFPNVFDGRAQAGFFVFGATAAPVIVDEPVVSGVAREGEQLTCEPGAYGLDTYSLSYAWVRDGVAIGSADEATYLVQAVDRGHELACHETAANAAGSVTGRSAPVTVAVARAANQEQPEVFGDVRVGVAATCTTGRWSDSPTEFRFRWLLGGTPVAGATASTYVPTTAQVGGQLACEVIAVNRAGESAPAVSAARTVAAAEQRCTVDCGPPPCTVDCGPPPPCAVNCGPPPPPPCTVNCGPPVRGPGPPAPPSSAFTISSVNTSASLLTIGVRLPGAGVVRAAASWRAGRRVLSGGSATVRATRAGAATIRVRLSAAARRALARARGRRLKLTLSVTFTATGARAATVTRSVIVSAARRAVRRGRARR